jgi:hypothetical protein
MIQWIDDLLFIMIKISILLILSINCFASQLFLPLLQKITNGQKKQIVTPLMAKYKFTKILITPNSKNEISNIESFLNTLTGELQPSFYSKD